MASTWKVVYPKRVLNEFEDLYRAAKDADLVDEVERAAKIIDNRLRSDPIKFGDPCYTLPGMDLDLYVRAVSPLVVYYAVHRSKEIVFVKRIVGVVDL